MFIAVFSVLYLTVRGKELDILKGFELGADDYITKPYDPEELLNKLDQLVKEKPRLASIKH